MQNASFPSASVPTASMGGLSVSGQGGVILPNGQVALVRAWHCPLTASADALCLHAFQALKILTCHLVLLL